MAKLLEDAPSARVWAKPGPLVATREARPAHQQVVTDVDAENVFEVPTEVDLQADVTVEIAGPADMEAVGVFTIED
jgi:hypothetical protein